MNMDWQTILKQIFLTIVYTLIGLGFFMLSDWMVERVMPRWMRKQIEEDKNVALAIVVAAVILGVAMIISAAMHG